MLRIFQEWPFTLKTCFSMFTNVVAISTYKHCWCQEYSMKYSIKHHLVENCFQLYTTLVDESTSLVIAIIQFSKFQIIVAT
jgi:predicted AlkP superfamily phosphohydrolase/phosphomutase